MRTQDWRPALRVAYEAAVGWLDGLPERKVRPEKGYDAMFAELGGPVPERGEPAEAVIRALAETAEPGLMAMNHARFHGWVIGGAFPAGIAADWLVAAWDQNTAMPDATPATIAIESITAGWLLDLLDLPRETAVGFVTGGQMANFTCLAAARERLLLDSGWDAGADGLFGAPPVTVIVGEYAHHTVGRALRFLGLGERRVLRVPTDSNARMLPGELRRILVGVSGPVVVCAQAGEVNTGGVDPLAAIADIVDERRGSNPTWLHVDGAIGLLGRVSPRTAPLLAGVERADSCSTDAHKWLNTPYDCGIAFVRDPNSLRRAMSLHAEYLPAPGEARVTMDFNPEMSRRARATAVYATIREIGREGLAGIVERDCAMAQRLAEGVRAIPGGEVLNEVELNQVLVAFRDPAGVDDDAHTRGVLSRVQQGGVAYPSGTTWRGRAAIRISVCNWSIEESDADRTIAALADAHAGVGSAAVAAES